MAQQKGFGAKTEASILEQVSFFRSQQGYLRWDQALSLARHVEKQLQTSLPQFIFQRTGLLLRGEERLPQLEWVAKGSDRVRLEEALKQIDGCSYLPQRSSPWTLHAQMQSGASILLYICDEDTAQRRYLISGSSALHLSASNTEKRSLYSLIYAGNLDEADLYAKYELPVPPPPLRETDTKLLSPSLVQNLVQKEDLRGVLHCHSTYSDGQNRP